MSEHQFLSIVVSLAGVGVGVMFTYLHALAIEARTHRSAIDEKFSQVLQETKHLRGLLEGGARPEDRPNGDGEETPAGKADGGAS